MAVACLGANGEEVDERGAEVVTEAKSPSMKAPSAVAVVEATEVGDDLRKLRTKPKTSGIAEAHSAMRSAGWIR